MNLLNFSCCYYTLSVFITICIGIITYFKWCYSYWKKKNLPFLPPTSWYGNLENPLISKTQAGYWYKKKCYDQFRQQKIKQGGIFNFTAPVYFPVDPDYIKSVMQNDFQYFVDRGEYFNEKIDPLSCHLFALEGQKWRNLRAKLTPIFTSGKMKTMFNILVECSLPLKSEIQKLTEKNLEVDIKDMAVRYTTDVIGSCAFGLNCDSFKSPDAEFRKCGLEVFRRPLWEQFMLMLCFAKPWIGHFFNIRAIPKTSSDFFFKVVVDTVKYRKENNIKRNDTLQLLIDIEDQNDGSHLTIEEIAAQSLVFFLAGFETSSTTMTFCLYELARNPDVQQKVRDEINKILEKHDGKITYESISNMKYMTQVIEETLRKYPPLPYLTRKCVKDYQTPDTDVVIEKGTTVIISALGLHYDPEYYPSPEVFDPSRFTEEQKASRHPFTYIPFGEGPRICIGMRFGMMQTKVGLTVLLKNYMFSLNKKTSKTLTFNPKNFLLDTVETIWLDSELIN